MAAYKIMYGATHYTRISVQLKLFLPTPALGRPAADSEMKSEEELRDVEEEATEA